MYICTCTCTGIVISCLRLRVFCQIKPDEESDRCKVVVGSCQLDHPYKIAVSAVPAGRPARCISDIREPI